MIEKIKNLQIGEVQENVDIKDYTTFKVSCRVECLVKPKDENFLITLVKFLKHENIRYKVIGKGSNLVFVNPTFEGVIISLENFNHLKVKENKVIVGAGYSIMKLSLETAKLGLSGLEFASGIPGSVGGSIVNNAGAYNSDMASVIRSVKVLTPQLEIKNFTKEELKFCYRSSFLQYKNDYICLEAEFVLEKGNAKEIMETIQKRREKRLATQPLEYPSAGSVCRNPEGKSAWELIEKLGLKGKKIGDAEVSKKHANFIINTGNATGRDIQDLIFKIKEKVKKEYNIDLIYEQEFVE